MAIFPHFLAFSVTLLVVRTTVMLTLGIQRTQTLVTHVGWCYGAIFALPIHLSGVSRVQNMAIFGQNQASMAGWFQGGDLTWKVFHEPYHTSMHGTTWIRTI